MGPSALGAWGAKDDPKALVGQTLIVALRWRDDGRPITSLGPAEIALLRELQPGGVSLFAANLSTVAQTRALVRQIRAACRVPPFIAIDEEGGRVSRLATSRAIEATRIPPAETLGGSGAAAVWRAYDIIGDDLSALGVTMDFAPVADIDGNPLSDIVGDRAFANNPQAAAGMVGLAVRALQRHGVCAVVKHYPGHGRSGGDSHFGRQSAAVGWDELRRTDLVPFEAAFAAGAGGVMTAHIEYPNIDPAAVPVSMSATMVGKKLRGELGFAGLVVTDALDMRGILAKGGPGEVARASLSAGVDMLLCPESALEIRDALLKALGEGRLDRGGLRRAYERILAAKDRFGVLAESPAERDDALARARIADPGKAKWLRDALRRD